MSFWTEDVNNLRNLETGLYTIGLYPLIVAGMHFPKWRCWRQTELPGGWKSCMTCQYWTQHRVKLGGFMQSRHIKTLGRSSFSKYRQSFWCMVYFDLALPVAPLTRKCRVTSAPPRRWSDFGRSRNCNGWPRSRVAIQQLAEGVVSRTWHMFHGISGTSKWHTQFLCQQTKQKSLWRFPPFNTCQVNP